jgi:molybdopterin/thiamine biosynthesis adenylyltransferase/rhodanese-related sulfurtransferase
MAKSYGELLQEARSHVRLVTLDECKRRFDAREGYVFVDVREKDETRLGFIPGSVLLPRAHLEQQFEQKLPDRNAKIILYCASGIRSAFAAKLLQDVGYTHVESANPGFNRWKDMSFPVETPAALTQAQRDRYSRHILLPEVGEKGQEKLLKARVLLLGAGGLGSPAALYLAAAGVGTLGVIDADVVDASNLQRQILHGTSTLGLPKVESGKNRIQDLNPDVKVIPFQERLTSENIDRVFDQGWDVIVDGLDNFATRYLVNDACVKHGIPNVHGSIYRFEGQVSVFWPGYPGRRGPCYRCLYPEPPPPDMAPSCAEAGVLGVLPGVVGTLEAVEVIKILLGIGDPLVGRLIHYDALRQRFTELTLAPDPACRYCAPGAKFPGYVDYERFCASTQA